MRWLSVSLVMLLLLFPACSLGDDDDDDEADAGTTPTLTATVEQTTAIPPDPTATLVQTATPTELEPSPSATPTKVPPTATATTEPTPEPTATDEPAETQEPAETEEPATTPDADATAEPTATEEMPDDDDEARPDDPLAESFLLQASDLPEGWIAREVTPGGDDDGGPNICDSPDIDDVFEVQGRAEAAFEAGQIGPFMNQLAGVFASDDEAAEVFGLLQEYLGCEEWIATDDEGGEVVWTMTPLDFPELGDGTFARRATIDFQTVVLEGDIIVVQRGRAVSILQHLGLDAVDTSLTISAVEIIAERMGDI